MTGISLRDLERLRRRINSPAQQARGTPRGPDGGPFGSSRNTSTGQFGLEGREQRNSKGRFLVQERVFEDSAKHGRFPMASLQTSPASGLRDISSGGIGPIDPRRWAYLDTEATGLAGGTGTCAFLVGVGAVEPGAFRVRLFLMRDYDEEPAMLEALADHLSRFDALITYNGKAFDSPLLETRFLMNRQRNPLERLQHVDILHPARRIWRERMPNCQLGTLEAEILGYERSGDIPGALIPQRFFDFLRSKRGSLLAPIMRHNVIDIVSLACLGSVVMQAFAAPERAPLRHGQDLLGLARWLRDSGERPRALQLYRKAVRSGLRGYGLFAAIWESAGLERRAGNRAGQVKLLRELSGCDNPFRARALVELAKHYEHREKDCDHALQLTRSASRLDPSDALDHREGRLVRKIGARESADGGPPRDKGAFDLHFLP